MALNDPIKSDYIALLSAADVAKPSEPEQSGGALVLIGGQPLLSCQIEILRQSGIATFLIEVDSVTGGLLAIADRFRADGLRVEFIRSATDLESFLQDDKCLVVQAEGHYFSQSMVAELLHQSPPFIATIDSRDENAAFERIDLNTRWSGIAVITAETARMMTALPDGWSICSSLLRQAIQRRTRFVPVAQGQLQSGEIVRVETQHDAAVVLLRTLKRHTDRPHGLIEKYIFGPIAVAIVPWIWSMTWGASAVGALRISLAVASIGLAASSWHMLAAVAALLAIFANTMLGAVHAFSDNAARINKGDALFWTILIIAALFGAWTSADYGADTVSFVAISIGLALTARKLILPNWCKSILSSPALLNIILLLFFGLFDFATAAKIVALSQLAAMMMGLYMPAPATKNGDHA